MERDQIGKAKELSVGDWILIRSRNPRALRESDRIPKGWHYFDVVEGILGDGSIKLLVRGSIAPNTEVKKVGSETDQG